MSGSSEEQISLLLRAELRGRSAYGAPQIDVPVRLNTNENSFAVPETVAQAMAHDLGQVASGLNRYPDREFSLLREDLAGYLTRTSGIPLLPEQVWAGNGSNEVLLHVVQAFGGPGRSLMAFTPSYSMYPNYALATGTRWIDGSRGVPGAGRYDLGVDDVVRQVEEHRPDIVMIASPNNPTGTAVDLRVVEAVHDALPRAVVVVDEAYAEFARKGTPSALSLLAGRPRLVISRTMSKAFALAGGRLGYLAADPSLVDALRLVRMPYHLSTPTQVIARTALAHSDLLLAEVEALKEQRDRIVAETLDMGLCPVPSDANFVLIDGFVDASQAWQALLDQGVLVRDVGLPGCLRVSSGTPAEVTAFLTALRIYLSSSRKASAPRDLDEERTAP
ncbi:histidinol-phosphate aminotransferase [Austwickia chelonae]|uniref:Histidinol-phosphate aminotransferase n=1 Tax=Austwickia chelonae NBRC 105200 TaxID=1184607 RepID=K6VM49_9MICO|nr:histidinol-phosphate transaminase [Austwickia chelonae]GAB76460.1 histidinol-phosphate aminotransferase [Austwickia chelonae NBRC 105200]SEW25095.1 histidinol-phosphate aminotransferase [Austwickia chelonae]